MLLLRHEAQGHDQVHGLGSFPWGVSKGLAPETSSLTGHVGSAGPLWVHQTAYVLLRVSCFPHLQHPITGLSALCCLPFLVGCLQRTSLLLV